MKTKCKSPVRLGSISKYIMLPISYAFFDLVSRVISLLFNYFQGNQSQSYTKALEAGAFTSLFFLFFTKAIVGIIGTTASYYLTKEAPGDRHNSKITHTKLSILSLSAKQYKTKYIVWICMFNVIEIVKNLLFIILTKTHTEYSYIGSMTRFLKVLLFPLLNFLIFNSNNYRHHWFAIIIIIIGFFLDVYLQFDSATKSLFLSAIPYLLELLQLYLEKWILHFKYLSLFYIILVEGILGSLISGILLLTASNLKCSAIFFCEHKKEYLDMFFIHFSWLNFLFLLINNIPLGLTIYFRYLTNQHYFPTFFTLPDLLITLAFALYNIDQISYGLIPIGIGVLIYNEIVIIDICNLAENSKAKITERSYIDFIDTIDKKLLIDIVDKDPYIEGSLTDSVSFSSICDANMASNHIKNKLEDFSSIEAVNDVS